MILSFLLFAVTSSILFLEGRVLLALMLRGTLERRMHFALAFPLGAFLNALLFFLFTLLSVPLMVMSVFTAHALLLAIGGWFFFRKLKKGSEFLGEGVSEAPRDIFASLLPPLLRKILLVLLTVSLLIKVLYGVSHAVLLPTFYYDSLSQWNMRSRVSLEEHMIVFDDNELRGISKPQYPILLHSLQIFSTLPQRGWSDPVANGATFLLTLAVFSSLFLFLRARGGALWGLIGTSGLFLLLPLLTTHLVQGYGDLHVTQYLLLSALLFLSFTEKKKRELLLLSALFIAAAAWVKQEGLFFGVLPWLMMTTTWFLLSGSTRKHDTLFGYLPAILLGGLWSVFLTLKGFPIGAHSGDFSLELHPEALPTALQAFFSNGSFGITPFVLPPLLILIVLPALRSWKSSLAPLLVIAWGLLTFCETLIVYFFTPNVNFLLNGQTFSRTMLMPFVLLILGGMMLWEKILLKRGG